MSNIPEPAKVSAFYRKRLEKHELTPEEKSAVRYAIVKHTAIAAATTVTLGMAGFFYGRSRAWPRAKALALATAGNLVGLGAGAAIAFESGFKTVESQLQGTNSELVYLIDRYSKATLRERMGVPSTDGNVSSEIQEQEQDTAVAASSARMLDESRFSREK
ncbi:hypothetical protein DFQ27_005043 [Actinomortierella ambigua]|uniref:Uncharacterized protein n=1 Tax=Actinomortierella ambigua TaxID=1343610 RepID=A0A9P6PZX1_9FUNG|nr:hypothetical protein DFQ27_005043 [Actinomortierella ambigua]